MGKEKEEEITKLREKGLEEVVEVGAGVCVSIFQKIVLNSQKVNKNIV